MTCSFCGHGGELIPASMQPGTDLYMCADRRACLARDDGASDEAASRMGLS